jgi:hypothetical protein
MVSGTSDEAAADVGGGGLGAPGVEGTTALALPVLVDASFVGSPG